MVRSCYATLSPDTPTLRAHGFGLLRAILHTAVYDGEISANPAHIRGAGTTTRTITIRPATLDQLTILVRGDAPATTGHDPARRLVRPTVRRDHRTPPQDLDLNAGIVHVHRFVTRVDGQYAITTPKSAAGRRDIALPHT